MENKLNSIEEILGKEFHIEEIFKEEEQFI